MRKSIITLFATVTICLVFSAITHRVTAQDAAAPLSVVAKPAEIIDQIMTQIGQGRIDDAVATMDGLKNQADLKQAARSRLLNLRDEQGQYRGYDIAAIQRFTPQFETVDVIAYYDDQPVLLRFHFYRPQTQNNGKWAILGFQASTAVQEIADILKDTPVDYIGRQGGAKNQ